MADINLLGHKFSKGEAVAVGAGALVVIYFVWKQHQASAAASTGSASSIDPLTGLPASEDSQVDPDTGMTYLAEAQQYGSVAAAEQAVAAESSLDYSTAYDTGAGTSAGTVGTNYSTTSGTQTGTNYANNAQWSQAVQAGLTDIGYSSTDVSAALGLYFGGAPLTTLSDGASALSIVQAALAEYGPPPVGSYSVIVPASTTSTTSGNTGTGTSTGTTTATTTTSGSTSASSSAQTSTVSGGKASSVTNNTAVVSWNHSGPATSWKLTITGPGAINGHTATVGVAQGTYSGLEAGHDYEVTVQPLPSGTPGTIAFKTTDT